MHSDKNVNELAEDSKMCEVMQWEGKEEVGSNALVEERKRWEVMHWEGKEEVGSNWEGKEEVWSNAFWWKGRGLK